MTAAARATGKRIKFKARIRPINQPKSARFTGYAVAEALGWHCVETDPAEIRAIRRQLTIRQIDAMIERARHD